MVWLISLMDDNAVFIIFMRYPYFVREQRSLLLSYILGALIFSAPFDVLFRRILYFVWYKLLKLVRWMTGRFSEHILDYSEPKRSDFDIIGRYNVIITKFFFAFTYSSVLPGGFVIYAIFVWIFLIFETVNFALGYYNPIPDYNLKVQKRIWKTVSVYTTPATLYTYLYYGGVMPILATFSSLMMWFYYFCEGYPVMIDTANPRSLFDHLSSSSEYPWISSDVYSSEGGIGILFGEIIDRTVNSGVPIVILTFLVLVLGILAKIMTSTVWFLSLSTWRIHNGKILWKWGRLLDKKPPYSEYVLYDPKSRQNWGEGEEATEMTVM